jgi:hypothetical protein
VNERHRDDGSSLPLILLCFLVAMVLVAGVTAASSAFLAQRDLQSDCDGAAVAAASGADLDALYRSSTGLGEALPLATDEAELAVASYQAAANDGFDADVALDGERVTVSCRRVVAVPFGPLFGVGGGLERSTVSTARSRFRE